MGNPKIEAELKALQELGKRSKGDFVEEARRMIGTTVFDNLWKVGVRDIKGLSREVCRIARAPAPDHNRLREDIRVGQDAAAQCHS